jgi:poly(ADP-ribose) glycohydrolase ARH3
MNPTGIQPKFIGGMVGSALGDAIGEKAFVYPQEELLRSKLEQLSEVRYTDDTAMALGLAESIISKGCIDEQNLGITFNNNFECEPWRGYASGPPTVFALAKQGDITYSEAAQSLFGGQGSLGNGAAMRIVPVGLFFHKSKDIYEQACASARVTHVHPVGMDGAAVQAFAVAQAVKLDPDVGFSPEELAQILIDFSRTPEIQEKMRLVQQLIGQSVLPDAAAKLIGRTVAVHESMPFAVYSFLRNAQSFEDCICCAIMNGGDRDTLGAMAGAISGAYLGVEAIPQSWCQKLENREYIENLAATLAKMVAV